MKTDSVSLPIFLAGILCLAAIAGGWWVFGFTLPGDHHEGERPEPSLLASVAGNPVLELDKKSAFSHIKIVRDRNLRTLLFVRDNGDEVVESCLNIERPYDLVIEYTKMMFMSYVFRPKQEKVLIIGLGGGSMVHFLGHYDPKVKVDVVEIDPVIVDVADKFFSVRTAGNVKIITKDGFEFFKTTDAKYDVIYMDAFLKPSAATDPTGVALRLKTIPFYKEIQEKLTPDGLVVYNINPHDTIDKDVKTIRESFPNTYVFNLKGEGIVVVGSMSNTKLSPKQIIDKGEEVDNRFKANFSFWAYAHQLEK